MRFNIALCLSAALFVGACASTQGTTDEGVYDPFEPVNRGVFAFNEAADKAVIGPVAGAYEAATPAVARKGVSNFLRNLSNPVIFVNNVLQGDADGAGNTAYRFTVNTVFGGLGLFDLAEGDGFPHRSEDFGQTLGVWGVPDGPFLVLPILGPSNLRDSVGSGVDTAFDPLTWTEFASDEDLDDNIAIGRGVLGALNARVALDDALIALREQPEPYIAYRRTYTAQRDAAIRNGQEDPDAYQNLPDFDDFE
ncbi:MAG: VacJ family lipoprotein [Pseudomonadota bacterium]